MEPLNFSTILLLCDFAFNSIMSFYVIGMVFRPMLIAAMSGLIDLAQQAMAAREIQDEVVARFGGKSAGRWKLTG